MTSVAWTLLNGVMNLKVDINKHLAVMRWVWKRHPAFASYPELTQKIILGSLFERSMAELAQTHAISDERILNYGGTGTD